MPGKHDDKPWPFVEVIWDDACREEKWCHKHSLPSPARVITRGWIVKKDKRHLVVAASLGMGREIHYVDGVGEAIAIPKGCIISLKELDI